MSEGRDADYKPKLLSRKRVQTLASDRPRRATRKVTNYEEEAIFVDSDNESTNSAVEGAVGSLSARVEGVNSERFWSETLSDLTVKSEWYWSPHTVNTRTDHLIEGIKELKSQLQLTRMAQPSEKGGGASS